MTYLIDHTAFGFCWWDLAALLVLIGVIVVFIVKTRKQKKQIEELENTVSEMCAQSVEETVK